jgi:hypothetical protein
LRWRLKLEEFEYEVIHKKGSNNTNADALSRIHLTETKGKNVENELAIKQEFSEAEKLTIFKEFHDKPTGGHLGMNRTYENETLYLLAWHETRIRRIYKKL